MVNCITCVSLCVSESLHRQILNHPSGIITVKSSELHQPTPVVFTQIPLEMVAKYMNPKWIHMNLKVEKQFNPWDVMFAKQSEFCYCQASWISKPISSKDDDVQMRIPPTVTIDASDPQAWYVLFQGSSNNLPPQALEQMVCWALVLDPQFILSHSNPLPYMNNMNHVKPTSPRNAARISICLSSKSRRETETKEMIPWLHKQLPHCSHNIFTSWWASFVLDEGQT